MKHSFARTSIIALFAVSFAATAAFAEAATEDYTHSDAKLQFKLPKSWKVETEDDLLAAEHPSGQLAIFFFVADEKNAEAFFTEIAKELDKMIQRPEITKGPREEKVNGLTQHYVEGTGRMDGEAIDFDLTYVSGGSKPMVALAIGKIDESQKTIDAIYQSIAKAK